MRVTDISTYSLLSLKPGSNQVGEKNPDSEEEEKLRFSSPPAQPASALYPPSTLQLRMPQVTIRRPFWGDATLSTRLGTSGNFFSSLTYLQA